MRLALATIALLSLLQQIVCWSDLGHRTVAYVAEKCLKKPVHKYIADILANDKGYDFSDAATWADTIKRGAHARNWTKPWHYIGKT
jgi:hypothetical protein